ncbi:hypothetical protein [Motilimonas sp. 1_MG-2023]|uniref:hypothetical protein n=1 Tax=Motilimonas TaxID=1914248 RepID=UPI0026E3F7B6|nr:hypothetical protein [Motilimonas sp. 1_MG-2023]MDO6524269.1 hypothetical protein [Motilimonas sp. 1_MG-2023]
MLYLWLTKSFTLTKIVCLFLLFNTQQGFAALVDQDIKTFSQSLHGLAPLVKGRKTEFLL